MKKYFLHADMDAFFASVEQLDHPEYRGKPLIVSGLPGERRSVVSTASYEARKYGVHSAMSVVKAYQLCPNGIYVHPDMKRYHEKSEEIMNIFRNYSPDVVQLSVDEAFIDLTGTELLLGNPKDTAQRLKQEIKDKTGLTISVGLAPTMYLAKIASDFNKPDGLTVIEEGEEEKFLLSLPLNKLWGVGDKTRERLIRSGLNTTKAIHSKSLGYLQSLFGENCGTFLYNSVRGNSGMSFGEESKNHSISSETTFEFDLYDMDAIETELLQLSHTVMFRLRRENVHSRTVALKIRYDDFSTVSIQETGERIFISADDLYQRCIRLFKKKYNGSGGIRLLGVSADKVEDNSIPTQKDLFASNDEKKAKVEKAIMNLEKKIPGLKIEKARSLTKKLMIALVSVFLLSQNTPSYSLTPAEHLKELSVTEEAASAVYSGKDSEGYEYDIKGFWEASVLSGVNISSDYGKPFSLSAVPFQFTQKVDLSLSAGINSTWYFEGEFADGFTKNTITAGYHGKTFLKNLMISNRGISFPETYSSSRTNYSTGGKNNSTPGIAINLQGEKWKSDAVLRYDSLEKKSKTYYGSSSVSETEINPVEYITGRKFYFPSAQSVSDIKDVYVEAADGNISDTEGRCYRKLTSADYLIISSQNLLVLSKEAGAEKKNSLLPSVAVSFKTTAAVTRLQNELGSFDDENSYLGKIQSFFGRSKNQKIELKLYCRNLFTYLDSAQVLILQESSYFSPFADCSEYDGGYNFLSDAFVIHSESKEAEKEFSVETKESSLDVFSSAIYSAEHLYLSIKSADKENNFLPEQLFPLAAFDPYIYLSQKKNSDLTILLRSYTESSGYNIGTDAAEGTVSVYINDTQDTGFTYSAETGNVIPSKKISESDRVYITWYEDSSDMYNGAVSAAAGFKYDFTDSLSFDAAFTMQNPVAITQAFADSSRDFSAFYALSSRLSFSTEKLSASVTASAALENKNTTGLYRILSMDDNGETQNFHTKSSLVIVPENFSAYINSRKYNTFISLQSENNCTLKKNAAADSTITGYKLPLSFDFNSTEKNKNWAAININLGSSGSVLSGADVFNIALKSEKVFDDCDVYLQLGVTDDFSETENAFEIPSWKISKPLLNDENPDDVLYCFVSDLECNEAKEISGTKSLGQGWQQVTVKITEQDKIRLKKNYNARLIIISNGTKTEGEISAGPWSYSSSGFSVTAGESVQIISSETENIFSGNEKVSLFNRKKTNITQCFYFSTGAFEKSFSQEQTCFSAHRYFEEVSLDDYRFLNLYFNHNILSKKASDEFSCSDDSALKIILAKDNSLQKRTNAVAVNISWEELNALSENVFHHLQIDLTEKKVFADGKLLPHATESVFIDTKVIPSVFEIEMQLYDEKEKTIASQGQLFIDELYLSSSEMNFTSKEFIDFKYSDKDFNLKIHSIEIIKNPSFEFTASGIQKSFSSDEITEDYSAKVSASVNILGIDFSLLTQSSLPYSIESDINNISLNQTSASVKTEKPFLNVISFSSSVNANQISRYNAAASEAVLDFSHYNFPLNIKIGAEGTDDKWYTNQKLNAAVTFTSDAYSLSASVAANQKTASLYNENLSVTEAVSDIYIKSFSTGNFSSVRNIELQLKNNFKIPFTEIKPEFSFVTSSCSTENVTEKTVLDFCIPFRFKDTGFYAGWKKSLLGIKSVSSLHDNVSDSAYFSDGQNLLTSLQNENWFFTTIPFADFSDRFFNTESMQGIPADSSTLTYDSQYYLRWNRNLTNTWKDIVIPSSMILSVSRNLTEAESSTDYFILNANSSFNALNLFGKDGQYRKFQWYEQDYFMTSLNTAVKIPYVQSENLSIILSFYTQDVFYLEKNGLVTAALSSSYEDFCTWSSSLSISYKRGAESSPAVDLFKLIFPSLKDASPSLTRISTLSAGISKITADYKKSSEQIQKEYFQFTHKLEAALTANISANTSFTLGCSFIDDSVNLTLQASIGAKLNF